MNIERDVTDVIQITFSTLILSLILISENSEFEGNETIIIGLFLTILITFFHIIFIQLKIINPQFSKGFSISTLITTIIAIIGYFNYDLVDTEGVWENIGLSYNSLFIGSLIILFLASIVTLFSEQVKSDEK